MDDKTNEQKFSNIFEVAVNRDMTPELFERTKFYKSQILFVMDFNIYSNRHIFVRKYEHLTCKICRDTT